MVDQQSGDTRMKYFVVDLCFGDFTGEFHARPTIEPDLVTRRGVCRVKFDPACDGPLV